jgi:hypothetical protein
MVSAWSERVWPTGDGDGDAIAGGEHAMALDGLDDAGEQDNFIVGTGERAG